MAVRALILLAAVVGLPPVRAPLTATQAWDAFDKVSSVLQQSAVQHWVQVFQQELVHPLCAGYERPVGSRFQSALGWKEIPPHPSSGRVLLFAAELAVDHLRKATELLQPPEAITWTEPRSDLEGAVRWVCSFAPDVSRVARERTRKLELCAQCVRELRGQEALLLDIIPASSRGFLVSGTSVVLSAVWRMAIGWPDAWLTVHQLVGFPCIGDYPDVCLFRQVERPATECYGELSHDPHNVKVIQQLERDALQPDKAFVLQRITAKTEEECALGLATEHASLEEVERLLGRGRVRLLRGFGVIQGWEADGVTPKVRRCDNARASLTNECLTTHETIVCEEASFPVTAAELFARFWPAHLPLPELFHSTDDVQLAYRRILSAHPEVTVVAIYNTNAKAVRFYTMRGHNFGLVSAVLSWNRVSTLIGAVCRRIFGVPNAPYFDDTDVTDVRTLCSSAKHCLRRVSAWSGVPLAVGAKDVRPGFSHPFLGVISDLSRFASHHEVFLRSKPGRVAKIVATCEEALLCGACSRDILVGLCGKVEFCCMSAGYHRVGRAALTAIRDATKGDWKESDPLPEAVLAALRFLAQMLPCLAPRRFQFRARKRRPIIVYTDAMFSRWGHRRKGAMGAVIYDREAPPGRRWWYTELEASEELLRKFRPRKQYIGQLEAVACAIPYLSLPDLFQDREVVHFVDNTGALYGMAKGAASDVDTSRIVHSVSAVLAAAHTSVWWSFVASKANIADLPSRGAIDDMQRIIAQVDAHEQARWFSPRLPEVSQDWAGVYSAIFAEFAPERERRSRQVRRFSEEVRAAIAKERSLRARAAEAGLMAPPAKRPRA